MQCVNKSKPTVNYPECPSAWNYQTAAREEIKPQCPPLADYLLLLLVYGRTFIISIVLFLSENLFLFSASAESSCAKSTFFFFTSSCKQEVKLQSVSQVFSRSAVQVLNVQFFCSCVNNSANMISI